MRSTSTATLEILLGIGPLQNTLSVQATKQYYQLENAHGVMLVKEIGPRKLRYRIAPGQDPSDLPL